MWGAKSKNFFVVCASTQGKFAKFAVCFQSLSHCYFTLFSVFFLLGQDVWWMLKGSLCAWMPWGPSIPCGVPFSFIASDFRRACRRRGQVYDPDSPAVGFHRNPVCLYGRGCTDAALHPASCRFRRYSCPHFADLSCLCGRTDGFPDRVDWYG